jgi:hypothetical protein
MGSNVSNEQRSWITPLKKVNFVRQQKKSIGEDPHWSANLDLIPWIIQIRIWTEQNSHTLLKGLVPQHPSWKLHSCDHFSEFRFTLADHHPFKSNSSALNCSLIIGNRVFSRNAQLNGNLVTNGEDQRHLIL